MGPVSLDRVNRFLVRKQHLADDRRDEGVLRVVKDIFGLHATSPTTPYLSLFARCKDFTRGQLDKELYAKKSLAKIKCVRNTIYVVRREIVPVVFAATRRMVEVNSRNYNRFLGVTQEQYNDMSQKVMGILEREHGGLPTPEIRQRLKTEMNISPIVNLMCDQGLLIRGSPRGGWKSNIHTYHRFHDYYPDVDLNSVDEAKARETIIHLYVSVFGPVTENDITWWTGFPMVQVRQILYQLREAIISVKMEGLRGDYFISSADELSLKSARFSRECTVNLLPYLDPYLMGYKERERYLDSKYYDYIFDRGGNATSAILLDGRVIGVWDFDERTVKILLFGNGGDAEVLREIQALAKKTAGFISGREAAVRFCKSMVPLAQRTVGAAMSPLKDG